MKYNEVSIVFGTGTNRIIFLTLTSKKEKERGPVEGQRLGEL